MSVNVVLVDSGGANLGSVAAAFARLGVEAPVVSDPEEIRRASHVVLPGVGAAGPAMAKLREHDMIDVIGTLRQPVLGVCVGMQLMCAHSDEGDVPCLAIFPQTVARLADAPGIRVPHMGWNQLEQIVEHPLTAGLAGQYAYFVHSYAAAVDPANSLMRCTHGGEFSAVIARDNFMGAQFHPERSAAVGARLLQNFLRM